MKRVYIESPYAGVGNDLLINIEYARLCFLDSMKRGESPYASHLLFTQMLEDDDPEQRKLGIACGSAWREAAELTAFYVDLGMSPGMQAAWDGTDRHFHIEKRQLPLDVVARLKAHPAIELNRLQFPSFYSLDRRGYQSKFGIWPYGS